LQWIEEVRAICGPSIPVLLVACKVDLRDKAVANGTIASGNFIDAETVSCVHTHKNLVPSNTQGARVAQSIGARGYYETSALLNKGVDAVFEAATRAAMVVRDQGYGGVGGENKRDTVHSSRREKGGESKMGCCIIA